MFPDLDPGILWDNLMFGYENMGDITHCDVVSDEGWVGPYARMIGVLVPCDIRIVTEKGNAREWIRSVS